MSRLAEIAFGIRWAFRFENPLEILAARHLFRRKKVVVVEHGGASMLIDSTLSDAQAVGEVLLDGMYDDAIDAAGAGRTEFRYLNLGANIGAFDIRIFQRLGSRCGKIDGMAVEMNPATHARLALNLELNRHFSIRALNAAAWSKAGTTRVAIAERDTGQACDGEAAEDGVPVPMIPWGELFLVAAARGPIDLLKIDIEGAEKMVVPEITAEQRGQIRFLVIETHGHPITAIVNKHLTGVGFSEMHATPGDGDTCLTLWKGKAADQ